VKILRWQIGDATILRIGEVDATVALQGLIPMLNSADISRAPWLRPDFVDEMGRLRGLVQAFLIMVGSQTIVVDPGVGNGKHVSRSPDGTTCTPIFSAGFEHPEWNRAESITSSIHTCILTTLAGTPIRSMGPGSQHFQPLDTSYLPRNSAIGSPYLRTRSPTSTLASPTRCCRSIRPG